MKNVQGSSAGAGSGEFHVYKASRRREYERLKIMEDQAQKVRPLLRNPWRVQSQLTVCSWFPLTQEAEVAEFEQKKREWEDAAEAKTAKKRPRIDMAVEPRERKRGKTMFGLVLGTLTKAKNEDKERNASDAVRLPVRSSTGTCADCRSSIFVLCCPCTLDVVCVCVLTLTLGCAGIRLCVRWHCWDVWDG